jgi:hypothetical protein
MLSLTILVQTLKGPFKYSTTPVATPLRCFLNQGAASADDGSSETQLANNASPLDGYLIE